MKVPKPLSMMSVAGTVLAVLLAGCGPAAAPTATAPVPTPTTAAPVQQASPTPAAAGTQAPASSMPSGTGYPPEKAKQLLAENMYLPGMSYGDGQTPQYGGTANFSNKAELPNDEPVQNTTITQRNVLGPLVGNGGLVVTKRRANAEPRPVLATEWAADAEFKVWTFKLRQGVKWHDGTPVTAADVKWSYDLGLFPPKGRRTSASLVNGLPGIQKIEVVDDYTVRLVFDRYTPHLIETLAWEVNEIALPRHLLQKEIFEKGNIQAGLAPANWVSWGPYKFSEYVRGGHFKVVRYDQYWEKDEAGRQLPFLDAVTNTPIPDRAVALGAFRAGRLEAMSRGVGTSLDTQEITIAKRTFGDKVWFHRYPYLAYGIGMQVLKPPFDDIRVRKAVNLFMDRDEGAAKMQGGLAFSSGFLSPASSWHSHAYYEWPGFNPKTKKEDQAEALKLMKEAGVVGQRVGITCRQDYLYMCEFIDHTLAALGFDPFIELVDVNAMTDRSNSLQFQTQASGVCDNLTPSQCMRSYVTTAAVNRYNDKKIDEWQDIILTATDPMVRRQALWDAEKYFILEKAYNAPFWREEVVAPYRTYLKGSIVPGNRAHENSDRATDWIDKSMR